MAFMDAKIILVAVFLIAGCAAPTTSTNPTANPVKEFNITVQQYQFSPSVITVNSNDQVLFNLVSKDNTYDFGLEAYSITETLKRGELKRVRFIANQPGEFQFYCSECNMTGTFIVLL